MPATVKLNTVPVQNTENTRAALVTAYLPDVINRMAGIVHVDDNLLLLQSCSFFLCLWLHVLATLENAGFGAADCGGLR